jgi:hypothetical protein
VFLPALVNQAGRAIFVTHLNSELIVMVFAANFSLKKITHSRIKTASK